MTMHPRLKELIDHLDRHHVTLLAAIDRVPEEQRRTPPAPGAWSVVDVVEHLGTVAGRIGTRINELVASARTAGAKADPDESPILPMIPVDSFVDRGTKREAPTAVQPQRQLDDKSARERLALAHAQLRKAIADSQGVNLSELTMPHGQFGMMNLYHWVAFAGSHESRHAVQIDEIGNKLAGA
jgi:hypothetical protein